MTAAASFAVPQKLTQAEAMAVLERLRQALAGGLDTVDLSGLSEFDSAAIAVLLAARRASTQPGLPRFINIPDKLSRLASLYGVDALLFDHS